MLQVNYLREELQMLSLSNHVAIVTVDGRPGPGAYGITAVVVGAIGYLFIRWKVHILFFIWLKDTIANKDFYISLN